MMHCDENSSVIFELCALDKSKGPLAETTVHPEWERVNSALIKAFESGGFVDLKVLSPETAKIKKINMKSVFGKYRLTVLTNCSDPRMELLEWWEPGESAFRGNECLGDDEWDARTICSDIKIAQEIFRELFTSGGLSENLTQMRSQWDPKP